MDKDLWKKLLHENTLTEASETLVATAKVGNKNYEMFKTFRWGGLLTHIVKKNGKEIKHYSPNLDTKAAIKLFKNDYDNVNVK